MSIQDERSQHKNKAKAFKVLRALLFKAQQEAQQAALSASKMQLAGSGDRSERIRTYNFPQVPRRVQCSSCLHDSTACCT